VRLGSFIVVRVYRSKGGLEHDRARSSRYGA